MSFSALDAGLTGPLFATPQMRDVFSDAATLDALLACEAALAAAQAGLGLVPDRLHAAIAALSHEQFDAMAIGQATAIAGVPTIPFLKALREQLPADLEPMLHKGATTQDIVDTALVLQMRHGLTLIEADLCAIVASLIALAEANAAIPCAGRTYGQHAAPLTFGYKVAQWCLAIAEVAELMPALRSRILVASLGGPVGTLASLGSHGPAVADAYARRLGLRAPVAAWHTSRARIAETGSWIAIMIGTLAKMATDTLDLASTEIGEVAEPHLNGRGGSSAMPHKRNPVGCTVILAAHSAAKPLVMTLLDSLAAAHERPAGAWHAEWLVLPQLFGLASGALTEAMRLANGLVVDPARMQSNLDLTRGLLFSDAVAAGLTPHLGAARAHEVVAAACADVRGSGADLRQCLDTNPLLQQANLKSVIAKAFDLGPAIDAASLWMERALAESRSILRKLERASIPCP